MSIRNGIAVGVVHLIEKNVLFMGRTSKKSNIRCVVCILFRISNIVIYSKADADFKQISLFAYRIIEEKKDIHLSIML